MADKSKPLTTAQVAKRLGVTTRTVARLVERGAFPNASRYGEGKRAPYVIPEQDVIDYEKKQAPPRQG